jgi:hypothetical protein
MHCHFGTRIEALQVERPTSSQTDSNPIIGIIADGAMDIFPRSHTFVSYLGRIWYHLNLDVLIIMAHSLETQDSTILKVVGTNNLISILTLPTNKKDAFECFRRRTMGWI